MGRPGRLSCRHDRRLGPDDELEVDETVLADEQLRLLFTCCHPALALPNRVALTLRAVAGLTTGEIASAFFVQESSMAQRLVRARQKITNAGIPYRIPSADLLPERIDGALAVLYLLFNQGYSATHRSDLADAAIRMTRNVVGFAPSVEDARSLLSLMLLHSSRRAARWRQQMVVDDDLQYPTGGVYLEVVLDERLVFRWGASGGWPDLAGDAELAAPTVTVNLRDVAVGTQLELIVTFPDQLADEEVRTLIEGGTRDGWGATIDRTAGSTAITGWNGHRSDPPE
jgi:hypothetical protein